MKLANNQNMLDIALQVIGDARGVFELCVLNDQSLTDFAPGTDLTIFGSDFTDSDIVELYRVNKIAPATNKTQTVSLGVVPVFVSPVASDKKQETQALKLQSLLDIALQEFGTLEAVFELSTFNNISVTASPGLVRLPVTTQNNAVRSFYDKNKIKPATGLKTQTEVTLFSPGLFAPGLFQ